MNQTHDSRGAMSVNLKKFNKKHVVLMTTLLIFLISLLSFQNCSKLEASNINSRTISTTNNSEQRNCTKDPTHPNCPTPQPQPESQKSCFLNGQSISHGNSITTFQNSTVPAGQTCASQIRVCSDGVLLGTGDFLTCEVTQEKSCFFNGKTIANNESVTYFTTAIAQNAATPCKSEIRNCQDGKLSGSAQYISCTNSIDLNKVFSAFASRFSTKAKKRSFREQKGPDAYSWVHNEFLTERFLLSFMGEYEYPKQDHLIVTQIGDTLRPGRIYDLWSITSNQIGINGTYQKADNVFLTFSPLLIISNRIVYGNDFNMTTNSTFDVLSHRTKTLTETGKTVPKSIESMMVDTKGHIGTRWALVIHGRDNNPQMPDESWFYDLGPSEGVFDPQYGAIGYRHTNVLQSPDISTWEMHGDIVDLNNFNETELGEFFYF